MRLRTLGDPLGAKWQDLDVQVATDDGPRQATKFYVNLNAADLRNYSRHYRQRLRAEVLLDMVSDITGVPEKFEAMPAGSRAIEVWTARSQSVFLDSFGRPDPNQDPPCERTSDTSVVQALHLMNAPGLDAKLTGTPAQPGEKLVLRDGARRWIVSADGEPHASLLVVNSSQSQEV